MGSSKTSRSAPGWQGQNTPRGPYSYSKSEGGKPYEGTIMSGEDPPMRKVGKGARDKSSASKGTAKAKTIYGES